MKLFKTTPFLFVYFYALCSCVSKKDLVYFQDMPDSSQYSTPARPVVLRPGDVLDISISTLPTSQLNTYSNSDQQSSSIPIVKGYTISEKGTIQLPVIGEVEVIGKTLDELRQQLAEQVGEYFQNASVKVHLLSFTVSILGEVARPGRYTVYKENVSLLDGLALGGDLLPSADRNRLHLIRTGQGKTARYSIDLQQDELFASQHFYLQPDDVIYIEPARHRSIGPMTPWTIALSSISVILLIVSTFRN